LEITLIYEAASIPGGSVGTTSGGGGGGGAAAVTGGNGSVALTYSLASGVVTLALPEKEISDVIAASANKTAVFNLAAVPGSTGVALPKAALTALAGEELALQFTMPQGTLAFDAGAAKTLAAQPGTANVTLWLNAVGQTSLSAAQQAAVKPGDLVFNVSAMSGTQAIRDLNGTLTVTLPYNGALPVAVWYLDASGQLEKLDCVYDPVAKAVTFQTDHLSLYVVGQLADGMTRIRLVVGSLSCTVNSVLYAMDTAPVIVNGRTMVPLRFVAEAMGATVIWNGESRTVSVDLAGKTVSLTSGELAPGLDVPALIVNDRTMVPVRYISEALGWGVDWDEGARAIDLTR
jgi:hypothetical protein